MTALQNFKDSFSKATFGITTEESKAAGKCIQCKRDAHAHCYSPAGHKEYRISGLCEECFDSIFARED